MKLMKTNKTALVFCASLVFGAVFLIPIAAKADNWIESSDGFWINIDYTFVDRSTGLVVIETGADNNDGSYDYDLVAIDCDIWYMYLLNEETQSRNYVIYPDWRTASDLFNIIPQGSRIDYLARRTCPDRNNLPYGDIR